MRWRTLKKKTQSISPKSPVIFYAPFASRALAFITDIFMIGLPISLILMVTFGYDQMHTAGAMDVITNNKSALKNSPNPMSSLLQIVLFMLITVGLWHRSTCLLLEAFITIFGLFFFPRLNCWIFYRTFPQR
jgi:hypothetical protein